MALNLMDIKTFFLSVLVQLESYLAMQFNNMDGHIKSLKVQYLIVGLLCWQKGEREGYSAHQS